MPVRVPEFAMAVRATVFVSAAFAGDCGFGQATRSNGLPSSPEDGGPRRLEVISGSPRLFETPSTDDDPIAVVSSGDVLANLRCLKTDELSWCEVRPFRGGASGFILAEYLLPAVGPDGVVPTGIDDSKSRVRKQDFDASEDIPCAQEQGQSMGTCASAVARSGGGDATVVATFSNGFSRQLYFVHGEFIKASATMSGTGTDVDWQLAEGLYRIRVDDQKFEIPRSFVIGGN